MLRRALCAILALMLSSILLGARAMERDELRAAWREMVEARGESSPYAELPDPASFSPGALTPEAQADALAMLNFARTLAGVRPVRLDALYALRAQFAALVLAANDELSHEPAQPAGMPDELYEIGFTGASLGNIAKFNWMSPDMLVTAVTGFIRDDGELNLARLGHRRWALDPNMETTGFGLANAASGNSYATMYAVDTDGSPAPDWDYVAWPCAQAFPVELMRATLPWSISLNPARYDVAHSEPRLTLTEEVSGAVFRFDFSHEIGDGDCHLNAELCGTGDCLIFRPALANTAVPEYVQNQRWTVELTGLRGPDGGEKSIRYTSEMVSVYPQDVANVELTPLEATLAPGEALQLSAAVIPAWADDLTLVWRSSDETVAAVDASGRVTALAPGQCEITAESVNGRFDTCKLTVG